MHEKLDADPILNEIVTKLRNHFKPLKIYLFGSQANGNTTLDSDYDLLLIVKSSDKNSRDRMREASQVLWGRKYSADIFIYTELEFNQSKTEFSSVAHTAFTEGLEL